MNNEMEMVMVMACFIIYYPSMSGWTEENHEISEGIAGFHLGSLGHKVGIGMTFHGTYKLMLFMDHSKDIIMSR